MKHATLSPGVVVIPRLKTTHSDWIFSRPHYTKPRPREIKHESINITANSQLCDCSRNIPVNKIHPVAFYMQNISTNSSQIQLLTSSTAHSASWEVNRYSARQEIPPILWNPKVHYHIHNNPPPVPILSQLDPVHTTHPTSPSILILSLHLCLGLPSGLLPSGFPPKTLHAYLLSTIRATCPVHLSLLDLMTPNDIWWVTQSIKLLVRVVHSTPPLPRTSWTRKQKQF